MTKDHCNGTDIVETVSASSSSQITAKVNDNAVIPTTDPLGNGKIKVTIDHGDFSLGDTVVICVDGSAVVTLTIVEC